MLVANSCNYPKCNRPVFIEPRTKIAHDYCGRTHAKEALLLIGKQLPPPHGKCHLCNLKGYYIII